VPTNISTTAPEVAAVPSPVDTTGRQHTGPTYDSNDDIEYRYMTFDSHIPIVPALPDTNVELPPCPDLGSYNSPFEWPRLQKQLMTYLSCSVNACAAYASGSYAFPEDQLTKKWNVSHVVYTLGITVFTLGFGKYNDRGSGGRLHTTFVVAPEHHSRVTDANKQVSRP
jgi:hypothetical protein